MQVFADEITLPETKPETEWIDGRAVQKVMPTREHAILQKAFLAVLDAWAKSAPKRAGNVLPEWRFRVSIPGKRVHPLVPDVTYMSFARLRPLSKKDRSTPNVPPEVVVEVLSPDDKPKDVETKRKEYLAWGVSLVLIADPEARYSGRSRPRRPVRACRGVGRNVLARDHPRLGAAALRDVRRARRVGGLRHPRGADVSERDDALRMIQVPVVLMKP